MGTGGTCYESNYAFFSLLRSLGYDGYLTINDMGTAVGCHSAIIILLEGRKHLVDVGLPLHAVLPLPERETEAVESRFFRYEVEAADVNRYKIWRRSHPRDLAFTLVDEPVSDADYRAITIHDYRHDGGQFLNEIVIHKVIDDQIWRFNSDDPTLASAGLHRRAAAQSAPGRRCRRAIGVDLRYGSPNRGRSDASAGFALGQRPYAIVTSSFK